MAFISFKAEGRSSYGIVREDGVFDLGRRIGAVIPDLKSLLIAQDLGVVGTLPKATVTDYAAGEFTYLPVISDPAKIFCIGINYEEHRKETGRDVVAHPTIFTRFADTLTGHESAMVLPVNSSSFDYEGELVVIIGKTGFQVSEDEAMQLVGGYSIFNDGSLRDWQRHTSQFTPGKNFPRTGGFGPALVTPEEVGALPNKKIETRLNGDVKQSAKLGDMIFAVPQLLAYISGFTRLSPGDIIATGTPAGVGFKREPPLYLKHGDRVDITIEGVGTLTNMIEAAAAH